MASAGPRCAAIGATLRLGLSKSRLNVRYKPDTAPTYFITPTTIKKVLKSGPIEQLLFCPCDSCDKYSGSSADERKKRYQNDKFDEKYVTVFALLLTENCAGLIWHFQKKEITLGPIYEEQLNFLMPQLSGLFTEEEVIDVTNRIMKNQFCFFARSLEIGKIDKEYNSDEALPIEEDEVPVGKGGFAEVFAFKILEEYKGEGYKDLETEKFARKVFESKKQASGLDEWCILMQIHKLIGNPHPHIIETLGAFQYGNTFSIIFPLAEKNLHDYLLEETPFTSDYLWKQMRGISEGLAYLHGLQDDGFDEKTNDRKKEKQKDSTYMAYHLDLKPENILILNGKMKIADFGLSKVNSKLLYEQNKSDSNSRGNEGGYRAYAPPEYMSMGSKHYAGHDIWSLGAIFSEVATHDIRLTESETNRGKASVVQYRKERQIDEGHLLVRSYCFHDNSKLKKSVHVQHKLILRAARDKKSAGDTELWQSIFYQDGFLELITQMLAQDPTKRGTARYVAETLGTLLVITEENQKKESSHLRYPLQVSPNIWDEAQSGKLQNDYSKPINTLFLKAFYQIAVPQNRFTLVRCVIFLEENGDDLIIHVLRRTQEHRLDRTEKSFLVSRHGSSDITEIIPLYATKRLEENEYPKIIIRGPRTNDTIHFQKDEVALSTLPTDVDNFQRLLLHQYPVSRFYEVSEAIFKGNLLHKSSREEGRFFLQLWCNYDLFGSRRHYEDINRIARVALLTPTRLYLIKIWNKFKVPPGPEKQRNPINLKPSSGDLNTHDIGMTDETEYKIPISQTAPKGYSTRFRDVSIKFADDSDIPEFWSALEVLQQAC